MQWRLFIEKDISNICFIRGNKNVAAHALSCLGILNNPMDEEHFTEALCSEMRSRMKICLNQLFLSLVHF
jgi:hypothetical protein